MSQYVLLIQTPLISTLGSDTQYTTYSALTTSHHPQTGLETLQNCCPVKLNLKHYIYAAHRSDNLRRTLEIKFRSRLIHGFWYRFQPEDIAYLCGITEHNFNQIAGLIHRQERRPDLSIDEAQALVSAALERARTA